MANAASRPTGSLRPWEPSTSSTRPSGKYPLNSQLKRLYICNNAEQAKQEKLTAWLSKCRNRIAHHYCKKSANGLDEQLIEVNTHTTNEHTSDDKYTAFIQPSPSLAGGDKENHTITKKKRGVGLCRLVQQLFVFDQLIRAVALCRSVFFFLSLCRSVFFSIWSVCRSVFFVFLWVCRRQNHLPRFNSHRTEYST